MNGVIRFSLRNPIAITVTMLTLMILGGLSFRAIPIDILPVFNSPAVQVLTFYGGMPAISVEKDITNRMERWTGQAAGTKRQESRSIVGASIVRNYYHEGTDQAGALTQVNSLATAAIPALPPGTLPPVVLPFDPTSSVPACLVALDSKTQKESTLYDVGRYEVRNMVMGIQGAVAPVVYGGKLRAVMAYIDRDKMQARNLSPIDVMNALDDYNLFLPTGDAKFGTVDYALDSNSMYDFVEMMGDIPLKTEHGNAIYLRDVAKTKDASMIQTNIVRVDGLRQVYVPVYRQIGASTLSVVDQLKRDLPDMQARLTRDGIDLKVVMDQSVYVRNSIYALMQEGILGAVLCSLVILLFLGEWKMTLIAVMTIPLAVMSAGIGLYFTGNTLNVMTLAGLSLAIGPLVDSAIICLENTHRHLGMGTEPREAAFLGASEVALPELVASCCTLLVLAPLAFMPGLGAFLFRPMAMAVAFAMISAYLLSRTFVPVRCALWLRSHHTGHHADHSRSALQRMFGAWEALIEACIRWYCRRLDWVMKRRLITVFVSVVILVGVVVSLVPIMRREFFPEVDAGAFEVYVRAPSGTRIEITEKSVEAVENAIREKIEHDLQLLVSEIGLVPDWSAAYTPNSGPMDAVIKVQLHEHRTHSAQEYVAMLREEFKKAPQLADLEFAFDAGGMIRGAMNEGKSTPINIRLRTKNLQKGRELAEAIHRKVTEIDGIVDARIIQRMDYPQYVIDVDRSKAADLGLTQSDIMRNVVAAFNSSIQFNKHNFWIDPVSGNQYFVGVQYSEDAIDSTETLLDIPLTSSRQRSPIPLRNVATLRRASVPTEVTHANIQPTVDLTMGVAVRDLGHVADDVTAVLNTFGEVEGPGLWRPYDPADLSQHKLLSGSKLELSGEYARMQETFSSLGIGLILASLLIYFLMAALFKSYVTPVVIMAAVPLGLVGVILMLYFTNTAINVQSLLGVIFMVGIVVSNTVLLVDFATNLRESEGLSPTEAIQKAAGIRVRPVVMTAVAAFFALVPMALSIERGSEANAPLGRAVIGGLLAGLVTTLFVVPALYSLLVSDDRVKPESPEGFLETAPEPVPV
ncbi:MAG: efflux RND transporter permease subunit [Planctomycetes bacterium]|nr:efflux RND transporter permease subunit [Planctomycetota bacterium]